MRNKSPLLNFCFNFVCWPQFAKPIVDIALMLHKRMVSNLQNASIIKGHSILDRTHASHQHMRTFTVPLNLNRIDKNGK